MGMQIGPSTSNLATTQSVTPRVDYPPQQSAGKKNDSSSQPFAKKPPEPDKVGFGHGTVSVPGVAVRTIDKNLEQAGEVVQSLQEVKNRLRDQSNAQDSSQQPPAQPKFNFFNAAADAVSRGIQFLNSVNATAGASLAATQGETPPRAQGSLDITIGDQTIGLQKSANKPTVTFFA